MLQSSNITACAANDNQTNKYDYQTFSFLSDLGVVWVTRLK